jgi:hypothetical protein
MIKESFKKIEINFIPHKEHKFTTIGHWAVENEILKIWISEEICWQNKAAVLFHELIEVFICISKGITTAECDEFDELFEKEYENGIWSKSIEAGFDKRCPYRIGHIWGSRFERIVIFLLGASWKDCNKECDELMM